MPEGPEVETIRLGLISILKSEIEEVKVAKHKKYKPQTDKIRALKGYQITDLTRRGKFLIFYFQNKSKEIAALNHLGMTGVWYLYSDDVWKDIHKPFEEYKHWKVYFKLSDDSHLLLVDARTFGRFEIFKPEEIEQHKAIRTLGPDILDEKFDTEEFIVRMRGKGKPRSKEIGRCLLDYNIVSGCGNIYKSEALFLSKINPFTPANMLSDEQLETLGTNLSVVGKKALKFRGSSLRDYKMVDGYGGLMQNEFNVYDLAGEPCVNCSSVILKSTQGDRSSFWCPTCQNNFDIVT